MRRKKMNETIMKRFAADREANQRYIDTNTIIDELADKLKPVFIDAVSLGTFKPPTISKKKGGE